MSLPEKTRLQFSLRDIFWALLACGALLSAISFVSMPAQYQAPFPFGWDELDLSGLSAGIPWLVLGVVYIRYRLFVAVFIHVLCPAILAVAACVYLVSDPPSDGLAYAVKAVGNLSAYWAFGSIASFTVAFVRDLGRKTAGRRSSTTDRETAAADDSPRGGSFTLVELLVVIAIIGMYFVLTVPERGGLTQARVEGRIDASGADDEDTDRPEAALLADDIAIEGRWCFEAHGNSNFWLDAVGTGDDESYSIRAGFYLGSDPITMVRTGTLCDGELVLNRPVGDREHRVIYTRLFTVRWKGRELLVPSVHIEQFRQCRVGASPQQTQWRQYVMVRKPVGGP